MENVVNYIMGTLIMIGLTIAIISLGLSMGNAVDRMYYHSIDRIDTIYIESLKDGSVTAGYFALGSGSVNGKDVYIYYTKNKDNGYIRNNVNADKSIIYMDENIKPYIICHYVETDHDKQQFINSYDFHVPNGTIMKSFSV